MSSREHGLTKENMLRTLPQALRQDPDMIALADAAAEMLERRRAEINRLLIYPAIDQLDEALLDILAYDFKVDWWDADYTLEEKRQTLKDSWRVHKLLGTKAAVETAISAIYPNTKVLEWFEYGGEPYHFKLLIDISKERGDKTRANRVMERANYYKNLRSHLDLVEYVVDAPVLERPVFAAPCLGGQYVSTTLPKLEPKLMGGHVCAAPGLWGQLSSKTLPRLEPELNRITIGTGAGLGGNLGVTNLPTKEADAE